MNYPGEQQEFWQPQESQGPIIRTGRPKPAKKDNTSEWIALAITTAIIFSLCGGCYFTIYGDRGPSPKYGTAQSRDTIYDAKVYAKEAVRIHLKWPDDPPKNRKTPRSQRENRPEK